MEQWGYYTFTGMCDILNEELERGACNAQTLKKQKKDKVGLALWFSWLTH